MNTQISALTPSVTIQNGKVVTTSRAVAEFFGKLHKNVIQKIESLDCSKEFMTANFSAVAVKVLAGFNERETKCYQMTKDGFVFLVMGFTGKKAAQFKEAYIAEFNRMEAELYTSSINRTTSAVFIKFDIDGSVLFSEQVPHNAFVATIDGFIKLAKKAGYIVTTPELLIKKLTH